MKRGDISRFIYGGHERCVKTVKERVCAEVEVEYSNRCCSAGWVKRLLIRWEMHREIKWRLDRAAPPWGLYFEQ